MPGGWAGRIGYKGHRNSEAAGNILYLDQDGGYRTVFICQTSKNYTLECSLHLDKPDIAKDRRPTDVPISWAWPWVSEVLWSLHFSLLSVFCVSFYFMMTCGKYLCILSDMSFLFMASSIFQLLSGHGQNCCFRYPLLVCALPGVSWELLTDPCLVWCLAAFGYFMLQGSHLLLQPAKTILQSWDCLVAYSALVVAVRLSCSPALRCSPFSQGCSFVFLACLNTLKKGSTAKTNSHLKRPFKDMFTKGGKR